MKKQKSSGRRRHQPPTTRTVLQLILASVLLSCAAPGQVAQSSPEKIADAIESVKQGNFSLATIEQIAEANAVQSVPALKERFALSQDADTKTKIADALVRLGENDDIYWNYLIEQATAAVKNDIPSPTVFDARGAVVRGEVSPEFIAWTKAHNVSAESAAETVYGLPRRVAFLAETGDPRGIPLLRQGLQSPNYLIAAMSAKGLAVIMDKSSIPLIIEACKRAPSESAIAIADSLIYFDDAQAQEAADRYLPKEYAQAMRAARAQGKKPFHF